MVGLGENQGRGYSFQSPSGMLHGAAVNSGKAFFAPADGVCWVSVDPEVDDADNVSVHHLSLGTDADDQPLRTGAVEAIGRHVLFAAGKGMTPNFVSSKQTLRSPPSTAWFFRCPMAKQ
ncbi:hypothetical protein Pan14r_28690 [Crateriforma conspicua]|uniref:Uncharacterized protein n=1 Tax=Crateriforma conspicua TaxID=2527996 RepID=A0A5C5YBA8_9PLAN|nr:hypothetical protein Mal65_43350 [Crateriforma conspicua]TWT70562.1 hypothetical protein Pan14r_28690 [Crateriforma conspicua]